MDAEKFIKEYLGQYYRTIFETDVTRQMIQLRDLLVDMRERRNKIIMAGNGASAAIAAHAALDFTKQAGIKSVTFNEASLITALANDCSYQEWVRKTLELYAEQGDVVLLISSSGKSPNVVEAAQFAREENLPLVTFTGFDNQNPLKALGDINFWVDSKAYNIIENTHSIWLMTVCDLLIGKAEYSVS